jgi:hypothetical protein
LARLTRRADGHPGGVCRIPRDGLAIHPVRRSISRWLTPRDNSVWIVIRRFAFKTFASASSMIEEAG